MNPTEIFGQQANTGTVSFEELENAFKTPTQYQHFYEREENPSSYNPSEEFPSSLTNPENEQIGFDDQEETVDPEKAKRTGERIAKIIDTGIDFTLSNFVAKNDQSYKADEKDLEDIAQCWGEISQEHNWNIGPEWSLVILYLMVYGPLVRQAFADRKMALLEERQAELEERMMRMEQQQPAKVQIPVNDGNTTTSPFGYSPAN